LAIATSANANVCAFKLALANSAETAPAPCHDANVPTALPAEAPATATIEAP
jgi:hypothetical protein